jgi:hypothetical protein
MTLQSRRDALRREIDAANAEAARRVAGAEKALAKLDAMPDFDDMAEATIVGLVVTYGRSKPYVVIGYKAQDRWYLTGDSSPNKVTSEGLLDWLVTGGRRLIEAVPIAQFSVERVAPFDLGAAMLDAMREFNFPANTYDEASGRGM